MKSAFVLGCSKSNDCTRPRSDAHREMLRGAEPIRRGVLFGVQC